MFKIAKLVNLKALQCLHCKGESKFQAVSALKYAVICQKCGASGAGYQIPSYTSKRNWLLRLQIKAVSHWNIRHTGEPLAQVTKQRT